MPASPSIASADARPSLSSRTAAAATASSASRPTSPSAEDTLEVSPTPTPASTETPACPGRGASSPFSVEDDQKLCICGGIVWLHRR